MQVTAGGARGVSVVLGMAGGGDGGAGSPRSAASLLGYIQCEPQAHPGLVTTRASPPGLPQAHALAEGRFWPPSTQR